jgi:hypothetical protein
VFADEDLQLGPEAAREHCQRKEKQRREQKFDLQCVAQLPADVAEEVPGRGNGEKEQA